MLFFITLLGFFLRISFLNKPEGLWNDEYVSWFISSVPFSEGFWSEVLKQCHMPLYYLFLKPFTGCSDLILRLTSVLVGVLAIPVMYLVGKEFSKKCGIISALITTAMLASYTHLLFPACHYLLVVVGFYRVLFPSIREPLMLEWLLLVHVYMD